jgi:MoaA/NifB/PqqE/SkfB family radical SAM enzyme
MPARVLQLHPTLRCNLTCRHCYSSSSPAQHETLPLELLEAAVADARAEGYDVVSVSGGEPLLYRDLRKLLASAKSQGFVTTLTTNGMLVRGRRAASLAGVLDLMAISLDGAPATHDRIRNRAGAFERMRSALPEVRRLGIPFGFIFTLTQHNLDDLRWVTRFALREGADLLQIHPLEQVGRARDELAGESPDAEERTHAWVEVLQLQAVVGDRMSVQIDVADHQLLLREPERVFAVPGGDNRTPLADLVRPLVVEADGVVVPLQYGMDRAFALGSLRHAPLSQLAAYWRRDGGLRAFQEHSRNTLAALSSPPDYPIVNWFDEVRGVPATA